MSNTAEIQAIQNVISRYTNAINRRDFEEVAVLFVPDGNWECQGGPDINFTGASAVVTGIKQLVEGTDFLVQMNCPAVISVDGNRATALSTIRETADVLALKSRFEMHGHYEDELLRTQDGWRFTKRLFTVTQNRKSDL